MPQRRGTVFQLGSAANRMSDGTIDETLFSIGGTNLSTSSLRDGFIDVYRFGPTTGATSDAPTTIDLSLKTAAEDGVAAGVGEHDRVVRRHAAEPIVEGQPRHVGLGRAPGAVTISTDSPLRSGVRKGTRRRSIRQPTQVFPRSVCIA